MDYLLIMYDKVFESNNLFEREEIFPAIQENKQYLKARHQKVCIE